MPNIETLYITFNITDDDKERQDGIRVRVGNRANQTLFDQEIVPPMTDNGNDQDHNAFYWPSNGDGKHAHSYVLPLSAAIAMSDLDGSRISVTSGYTGNTGSEFRSWAANVTLRTYVDGTEIGLKLSGADVQEVRFEDTGSPGNYSFDLSR